MDSSPVLEYNFGLALDIATSSPRYALGEGVLCSLRRLGLPIEVPSLPSTSRAPLYRTAIRFEVLEKAASEIYAASDSDDAVFQPRHLSWINEYVIYRFIRNRDEFACIPAARNSEGGRLQWGVMKIVRVMDDAGKLMGTLSRRIGFFGFDRPQWRAEVFVKNMCLISRFLKPFVAATVLRTLCNARPTVRRFRGGGSHSACRFGCSAVEGDNTCHYPFCPIVADLCF